MPSDAPETKPDSLEKIASSRLCTERREIRNRTMLAKTKNDFRPCSSSTQIYEHTPRRLKCVVYKVP